MAAKGFEGYMKDVKRYLEDVQKLEIEAKRYKQLVDIQHWIHTKNLHLCFALDDTGFKIFPAKNCSVHKMGLPY